MHINSPFLVNADQTSHLQHVMISSSGCKMQDSTGNVVGRSGWLFVEHGWGFV